MFYTDIIQRTGFLTVPDLVVGTLLIALVFEAARRIMGCRSPLSPAIFLLY